MPKVSKWKIEPKKLAVLREDFWAAITLLESKKEIREFLSKFLTPAERTMLAKRFQVLMMLADGHKYEAIRSHVHVVGDTISRMANRLEEDELGILAGVAGKINDLRLKKANMPYKSSFRTPGDLATPLANEAVKQISRKVFSLKRKNLYKIIRYTGVSDKTRL